MENNIKRIMVQSTTKHSFTAKHERNSSKNNRKHLLNDEQLKLLQIENCRIALRTTIVWIRNIGLSKGINITPEEMAGKAGITTKQLCTYLLNGYDPVATGDISSILRSSYKKLIKGITQVEIIEDIDTIIRLLP